MSMPVGHNFFDSEISFSFFFLQDHHN